MNMSKYKFWRIIALGCAAYIGLCLGLSILAVPESIKIYYCYSLIPLGIFYIYSIIYLMCFPLDLRIYVYWVFLFSLMAIAYGSSAVCILIGYCGYFLGRQIRYFSKHKKVKISVLLILYILFGLCQLRLEKPALIDSIVELLVCISAVLCMHLISKHILKKIDKDIFEEMQTTEDIHSYFEEYNFTERDKKMLEEVLAGCKYEEIAINHELSLSSVKKRLAYLYKKLGVTCQIDFIIKFAPKN